MDAIRDERPRFAWMTPGSATGGGAVAIVQVHADAREIDRLSQRLGLGLIPVGEVRLRELLGVDEGLVLRPAPGVLQLTPHAGAAVARALDAALRAAGVCPASAGELDPRALYPEAGDLIEACALDALAWAASPLAVGVIFRQVQLWRDGVTEAPAPTQRRLMRLLVPPTVAAVGHANVGKSTLVNALARSEVSITADEPGTTLDHVGVTLELDGLSMRWLDTPGWTADADMARGDDPQARALGITRAAVGACDLVIVCGDGASGFLDPALMGARADQPVIRAGCRSDLGEAGGADVLTSAVGGEGLDVLARRVRRELVSDDDLGAPCRWRFHAALATG